MQTFKEELNALSSALLMQGQPSCSPGDSGVFWPVPKGLQWLCGGTWALAASETRPQAALGVPARKGVARASGVTGGG